MKKLNIALSIMMIAVLLFSACGGKQNQETIVENTAETNAVLSQEEQADEVPEQEDQADEIPEQEEQADEVHEQEDQVTEESMKQVTENDASANMPMEQLNSKLEWNSSPEADPHWDKYRTFYELFVWSFCDSNGDGIGDLPGVCGKLDYLKDNDPASKEDLGCTGIWLMPVFPSPSYHKYDATDFYSIDPMYGTMEDFEKLIAECHARDIKLILDLPINDSSVEHPWFQEAAAFLREKGGVSSIDQIAEWYAECPYLQYYNYALGYQEGYAQLEGTNLFYEARFWLRMPDLNLSSEAVRQEIQNIAAFWLEKGVDGFRLDAVTSYFTADHDANIGFLAWFNDVVKSIRPDAYLVGEAWENEDVYARYYESGIDSMFDFAFSGSEGRIAQTVQGRKSALEFVQDMEGEENLFASHRADAVNAPFYTNHDMARSTDYYFYDGNRTKMAGALNLLMTGNAFIYYGEELGMKGPERDESCREPVPWTDPGVAGMCAGPPERAPQEVIFGTVESQLQDPLSIFHYYRNAVRIRNAFPVIARGRTTPVYELSDHNIGAFIRTGEWMKPVLIVFNTAEETRTVSLSAGNEEAQRYRVLSAMLTASWDPVILEGDQLVLPPFSIAVLETD